MSSIREVIRLNILQEYDVNWSLEFIVRDFVQNYFDSLVDNDNYTFDHDINLIIDYSAGVGCITGPVEFDWEELRYLGGTTKSDKSKYAGGFGEGFLIACLCLKKLKPEVQISMTIGNVELKPFIDSDGKRREMCFEKIDLDTEGKITGSCLKFSSCDRRFLSLLSNGKSFFVYPENPKFVSPIYGNPNKGIFIYQYCDSNGRVFYRHQDRGPIVAASSKKVVPFAICYNFEIPEIPNTRDRIDLDRKSINRLFDVSLKFIDSIDALRKVLQLTRRDWEDGNIVLQYLSNSARLLTEWNWSDKKTKTPAAEFPPNLLATHNIDHDTRNILSRLGFLLCPEYMAYFGMTHAYHQAEKIREQERLQNFRNPTDHEMAKYNLLYEFYDELSQKKTNRKPLIVFRSKLKKGEYKESNIYLNENIFYNFAEFSATFLHEVSHRRGSDGSSGFTDILTMIIQLLMQNPNSISKYQSEWEKLDQTNQCLKNANITDVLLVPFDVSIHKTGCECPYCEKRKFRSFGVGIFDCSGIDDTEEVCRREPLYITYEDTFRKAVIAAENYSKDKHWNIHRYDLFKTNE